MTGGNSPKKVTTQELDMLRERLSAEGIVPSSATRGQISKTFDVNDRRARTLQQYLKTGQSKSASSAGGSVDYLSSETKSTWDITLPKTNIHTLDELIAYCKVDLGVWEVDKFTVNKWEMATGTQVGIVKVTEPQQLFQVKAHLKKRVELLSIKDEIAALKAEAKKDAKKYPAVKAAPKTGYALEVSIPDLHVGKLAWATETGWENYDVKIAEALFEEALETLLQRTSGFKFEKILFPVGNDLFHVDGKTNMTTAGTPQDVDGRYQKTFIKVRAMMTRAIERLRMVAPVDVILVPGNHDSLSVWHLGDSLDCAFALCNDVEIDNTPRLRKYRQFGKVMLLWTHGDKGKLLDYPLVMAVEEPSMFGNTTHREAHTGHRHQTKAQEVHGVRVRISPALCPPDAWHSEHQFVGAQRVAEAFVWHKDEGLVSTAYFNVPPPANH
jgi:hypothetical protein